METPLSIKTFLKEFSRNGKGRFSLAIIFIFILFSLYDLIFNPQTPYNFTESFALPSLSHPFGTNAFGQDVFLMLIQFTPLTLLMAFSSIVIALGIGIVVGLISGYYTGKWFSYILDRITDALLGIPLIIFVGWVFLETTPNLLGFIGLIGLTTWPITAKTVRAYVLVAKEKIYVEASRAAGASDRHIVFKVILPEVIPVAIASLMYTAALSVLLQAGLAYLGFKRRLGTSEQQDVPYIFTWGAMLAYSQSMGALQVGAWWILVPPGACLGLLVLAIGMLGSAIGECLNPQIQRRFYALTEIAKIGRKEIDIEKI